MSSESSSIRERQIGEYLIKDLIGTGGFAKVYRAIHIPTKETVAIKIINKEELFQEDINRKRLLLEISSLKKVKHKNIIKLYEIMETPETIYLVMEYCNNGELFDFIVDKKNLDEKQACTFFQEVIDALTYLHSLNIVHRDVKPENILLNTINRKIRCKLIDFGISRTFENNELMMETPCGTVTYAPPEMHKGEKYNGILAEVWSLGVLLYTMICGYLPFVEEDEETTIRNILNGCYELPEELSPELKDLMKHLLDINSNTRYSLEKIKEHPWFNKVANNSRPGVIIGYHRIPIDTTILEQCESYGYNKDEVYDSIKNNIYDKNSAIYYIVLKKFEVDNIESISDLYSNKYLEYINDPNNLLNEEEKQFMRDEMQKEIEINYDKMEKRKNSIYKESENESLFSDESNDDNGNNNNDSTSFNLKGKIKNEDLFSLSDENEKNDNNKNFLKKPIGLNLDIFVHKNEKEEELTNTINSISSLSRSNFKNDKNKDEDKEINTSIIELEDKIEEDNKVKEVKEEKKDKENSQSFIIDKELEEVKRVEVQICENGIIKRSSGIIINKNSIIMNNDDNKNGLKKSSITNESTPLNNNSNTSEKKNNEKKEFGKNNLLRLFNEEHINSCFEKYTVEKENNPTLKKASIKKIKPENQKTNEKRNNKRTKILEKPYILGTGKKTHTIIKNRNASVNIKDKMKFLFGKSNENEKDAKIEKISTKNKLSFSLRKNDKYKYNKFRVNNKKKNAVINRPLIKRVKIPKCNEYKGKNIIKKNSDDISIKNKASLKRKSFLKNNEKEKEKVKEKNEKERENENEKVKKDLKKKVTKNESEYQIKGNIPNNYNIYKTLNYNRRNTINYENRNNSKTNNIFNNNSSKVVFYNDQRIYDKGKNKELFTSFINKSNYNLGKNNKKKNISRNYLYNSLGNIEKKNTFNINTNKILITNELDIDFPIIEKKVTSPNTEIIKRKDKKIKIQKYKGPLDTKNLIISNDVESIKDKISNALNLNKISFWNSNPLKYCCCAKNMDKFSLEITLISKIKKNHKKYNTDIVNTKKNEDVEEDEYLFYLKLLLSKESNDNPNKKLLEKIINNIQEL